MTKVTHPAPPPNKTPRAYKDTFWNRLRVAKGLSYKEIGKQLGKATPQINDYFTGRRTPNDEVIHKLCDLFNIDFALGRQEFIDQHTEWFSSNRQGRIFAYSTKENVVVKTKLLDAENEILEILYDSIPFRLYQEVEPRLRQRRYEDMFRFLYENIDFDTYYKIQVGIYNLMKQGDASDNRYNI